MNEACKLGQRIIDQLDAATELKTTPRTYRRKAHQAHLGIVKRKRLGVKLPRCSVKQQLQYLRTT